MQTTLTGVLENGKQRTIGILADTRQVLTLHRGESAMVRLHCTYPTGEAVDFGLLAATVTLMAKRRTTDTQPLFSLTGAIVTSRGKGWADFTIPATTTANLKPGRFVYAVHVTTSGSSDVVIPASPLLILAVP